MAAKDKIGMSIVVSTFSDMDTAKDISRNVIQEELAACASIMQVSSIYMWKKSIEDTSEFMVFYKTATENVNRLTRHLEEHHPYDTPEIVQIPVQSANKSYMQWLFDVTH
ncbi:MAG: divalent-cation tolerance protein CutA [Cenarchaeum sp. SB0665_bin_23]|nr:divalent-cation tolerance protein CutA [Cenarchaeum sp. SB0665_bin_23]MYG33014.1 divalent-cation tolerance protein CutA [Cenarchaeum sp. SB0677_bin_16]